MVPILSPCSACSCRRSAAGLGHCCSRSISGKGPDQPNPRVPESQLARRGCSSSARAKQEISSRATAGPCGDNAAQMAILKTNERASRPPLTSSVASLPRRSNARSLREVMQDHARSETVALAQRRIPMPEEAPAGVKASGKAANPKATALSDSLRPLCEVRRRSRGGATPGSTLALQQPPGWRRHRWRLWLISPHTHLLDGRHGVTTAMIVQAARAAQLAERCGPTPVVCRGEFVRTRTRPSARPDHGFAVGQGLLEGLGS